MNDKTLLYIQDIVQETADTITMHFVQPEQELSYLSGQLLTLILEIEGKEHYRRTGQKTFLEQRKSIGKHISDYLM